MQDEQPSLILSQVPTGALLRYGFGNSADSIPLHSLATEKEGKGPFHCKCVTSTGTLKAAKAWIYRPMHGPRQRPITSTASNGSSNKYYCSAQQLHVRWQHFFQVTREICT